MATIKSYSDLQQSKKLLRILPIESSDMYWDLLSKDNYAKVNNIGHCLCRTCIYAWSLAALLDVLPIIDLYAASLKMKLNHKYYMEFFINKRYVTTEDYNNPVDACYELILKLNELNLL